MARIAGDACGRCGARNPPYGAHGGKPFALAAPPLKNEIHSFRVIATAMPGFELTLARRLLVSTIAEEIGKGFAEDWGPSEALPSKTFARSSSMTSGKFDNAVIAC